MPPKKRKAPAAAVEEEAAPATTPAAAAVAPAEEAPAASRPKRGKAAAAAAEPPATAAAVFAGFTVSLGAGLDDLKADIVDSGGKVLATLTKAVTHVIVSDAEFEEGSTKVTNAEGKGLPILKPSFVEAAIKAGDWQAVKLDDHVHEAAEEEAEPEPESPAPAPAPAKKKAAPAKSAKSGGKSTAAAGGAGAADDEEDDTPQIRTLIKKGRAPLDPFLPAEVSKSCHVYESPTGDVFDVMLNQSNVGANNNKFYVIQLLESDDKKRYYCFTRWGRVGVPGQQALKASSLDGAKGEFLSKFREKTKNDWANRASFVAYPGKYTWLEMAYDDDEPAGGAGGGGEAPSKAIPDSKLEPRLRSLIDLICDTRMMEEQMKEIGFDARKMPLGKLSSRVIKEGYEVLTELAAVLDKSKKGSLADLSSRFYTVIPHDFGFARMSNFVIDSEEKLKQKMEMVQSLGDIEIATRVLGDMKRFDEHPADAHYRKLRNELVALDASDPVVGLVEEYVRTTHGKTHNQYDLHVEQVFATAREGEAERFEKIGVPIGNRVLLWHGSRLTNFVGILSQGLRIAPPEAPVTGYMFGKGVYFADCVSKSANYCFTSRDKSTGLMLLCEVALGKPRDLLQADYNAGSLPPGCHSTKGVGRIYPDPAHAIPLPGEEDVTVPMGPNLETNIPGSSLYYNEFIVYDVAQIKLRYLVKLNFKYKAGY